MSINEYLHPQDPTQFFAIKFVMVLLMTYYSMSVIRIWTRRDFFFILLFMLLTFIMGAGSLEEAYKQGIANKSVICQITQ